MSILSSSLRRPDLGADPDPDLNLKTAKKYTHGPKSKATEILKVHMAFMLTKKVEIGSFIKASVQIRPEKSNPDPQHCTNCIWGKKIRLIPQFRGVGNYVGCL
jgi:hypothetical protein